MRSPAIAALAAALVLAPQFAEAPDAFGDVEGFSVLSFGRWNGP